FVIQVFASPTSDPTGHGEGKTLLFSKVVMTNAQKTTGPITQTVPQSLLGLYLSATATAFSGDTSEFSQNVTVTAAAGAKPGSGHRGLEDETPATHTENLQSYRDQLLIEGQETNVRAAGAKRSVPRKPRPAPPGHAALCPSHPVSGCGHNFPDSQ